MDGFLLDWAAVIIRGLVNHHQPSCAVGERESITRISIELPPPPTLDLGNAQQHPDGCG
jgi:hypothetical protein